MGGDWSWEGSGGLGAQMTGTSLMGKRGRLLALRDGVTTHRETAQRPRLKIWGDTERSLSPSISQLSESEWERGGDWPGGA